MFSIKQTTHRMVMQYHPQVGYIFVPNQKTRLENEKNGFFVVTNSSGFRSDTEFIPSKGNNHRILIFGDSYTAGDNCSNSDRFSDKLGKELNAQVYNYAVSGSGTDQHLLIYREFAKNIEADLIIICVQVDSIARIQAKSRESIDRITGKRVMVSKPYFTLCNDNKLKLNNVPVPRERVIAEGLETTQKGMFTQIHSFYKNCKAMAPVRKVVRGGIHNLRSKKQPYPDFQDSSSPGWKLMKTILEQFISEAAPLPVLIIPIPSQEFYLNDITPIYQPLFESMAKPDHGVFVADITTPLLKIPKNERKSLTYRIGGHFSPIAHNIVANTLADYIRKNNIIPLNQQEILQYSVSLPFKSKSDKYVLGLSCFYHNSAASLIKNGEIVAAVEEERFTRIKNDRRFPHNAVNYCLEEAGINSEHLDSVVYYDNSSLTFERIIHSLLVSGDKAEKMWMQMLPTWLHYKLFIPSLIRKYMNYSGLVLQGNHHRSHAASAFYPSPFDRAAILTIDGVGEWGTASIGRGEGNKITILKEMQFPNSLGLLYSAFTEFTGFKVNSGEYKMMGLAPYGRPIYKDLILDKIIDLKEDGSIELNMEYFSFLDDLKMTNDKFADLFNGPAREKDSQITRREMDIAKSIQTVTEEVILRMAKTAHNLTGEKKLCMAGGVALNCVANGRLLLEGPSEDIWIQPAAGDSGCALGAAYDVWHEYFSNKRYVKDDGLAVQRSSCWGPSFSNDEIKAYLDTYGYPYKYMEDDKRMEFLASALDDGKIIGNFSGRLEYGPRALGSRSIIGDPRNTEMQVNMNLKIKYRESFRPFAPSVLKEDVNNYFEMNCESPYMLLVAPVKKERRLPFEMPDNIDDMLPIVKKLRSDIPAITHVDYSARVQTVNKEFSPEYYKLIKAFKDRTGCSVVVNTSFNVRGEPIVCTPSDAYRCFMRTEIDILALGNFILTKRDQPNWPEGKGIGLESIKSKPDDKSPYDKKFLKELRRYFISELKLLSNKLYSEDKLKICRKISFASSSWIDASEPKDIKKLFEYQEAVLSENADLKELTEGILSSWQYHEDAEILKPLVLDLLRLGRKYPVHADLQEEIPDSIYAMF